MACSTRAESDALNRFHDAKVEAFSNTSVAVAAPGAANDNRSPIQSVSGMTGL
jgi:hypothetical protein